MMLDAREIKNIDEIVLLNQAAAEDGRRRLQMISEETEARTSVRPTLSAKRTICSTVIGIK